MNIGSEIKLIFKDSETFLEKSEAEFVKLFKASPTVLQDAATFVTFASPIVVGIETLVAPEAAPATIIVLGIIKTDLATLAAAARSISTATTAEQALTNIEANLPEILAAGEIKDPATASQIEAAVTMIGGELSALIPAFTAWIASLKASCSTPALTTASVPA
jgi:hypothetical protein